MADKTIITKAGLKVGKWNPDTKEFEYKITSHPFRYLRDHVTVEADVTLGDIFNMVEADPQLTEFLSYYSYCGWINEFHAAAKEPSTKEDSGEVVALEVSQVLEINEYKGESDIEYWQDFHGVGKEGGEHPTYSVSCTPVNELIHLPVRLDTKVECRKNWKDLVCSGSMGLSLLEVLDAIYYDISFHGGPKDNEAFVAEMKQMIDDIDAGRVETIPIEDVFKDLGIEDDAEKAE